MRPYLWLAFAMVVMPLLHVPAAQAARPACEAAATQVLAASIAMACGGRVEDESARTEYRQIFAEPNGTSAMEISAVPQRARRPDGSWAAIDTTLRRSTDAVVPTAAASSLRFSPGGTGPLASMTIDGKTFSLSWPYGVLPAPALSGDSATYAEVLPGVDLVVRATEAAFGHYLVVKTAAAAGDPRVRETRYRVEGDVELVSTPDGGLVAQSAGVVVATAREAQMWDTPGHLSERELAMSGQQPPSRRFGRVAGRVAGMELILAPDQSLLESGGLPLVIDPLWNPGQGQWAYATSNNTNATMSDGKIASGDPSPAAPILRSGNDTTGRLNRSFLRFDIGAVAGKHILEANISGRVDHTWKCGSRRPNYFYRTAGIAATPRQAWPGPQLQLLLGNNNVYANEDDCTDPNMVFEVFSGTLINDLQAFANGGNSFYYVGICACSDGGSAGESIQERWMRYFLNDFRLNISFNTRPSVPVSLTVDGKACATGASRPYIATATPTLRAALGDADGNSMTAQFETARLRPDNTVGPVSMTPQQSSIPNGGTAVVTLASGVLDGSDTFVATGDWDSDSLPDVVSVDGVGDMYLLPGKGGGQLDRRVPIGSGWGGFTVAGMADWDRDGKQDIIARDNANGNLWLYPGQGTRTGTGPRSQIGEGFNGGILVGLADWDRDGHQDIIAQSPVGELWLYPGESKRGYSTQPRALIGSGWIGYTYVGTKDWNRDGAPDLVVYYTDGQLWGYPGSGARSFYPGSPYRFDIGIGWAGYQAKLINDVNADAKVDILARQPGASDWFVYPGSGEWAYGPGRFTVASVGVQDGGRFAFRANAFDGWDWAPGPSGWCEFEVDTTPPAVPTITSDIYQAGQTTGSVGQTGRFTVTSSPDTQSFLWGFSDPPTTPLTVTSGTASIDWTPPSSGPRTLFVRAVDRAGNESNKIYQFTVAAETTAVGRWLMNEDGSNGRLADDTGNGYELTAVNGAQFGVPGRIAPGPNGVRRSSVSFDGVDDAAQRPALFDTSRSFSVSAWVKLDAKAGMDQTALSQQGAYWSAFYLQYDASLDRWVIEAPSGETQIPAPTWYSAKSTTIPKPGVWTHLVGTYDSAARQLRIYVNGVLEDTSTGHVGWNATGEFRVGRAGADWFDGSIAEVQVWNRMISPAEVSKLYDPVTNALVAKWDMSDVGPGPTFDASPLAHDLEFFPQPGGPQIPPAGSGHTGTGLSLDGIDDHARTTEPVVYTDQSFTVSAWVMLPGNVTGNRTAVSQHGVNESGFYLKYEGTDGRWYFVYGDMDATPSTGVYTTSLAPAAKGTWVHLVGIHDAQRGQITLYVNGVAQTTVGVLNPWNAAGPVNIGRVLWRGGMFEHWAGSIDEIQIYQGVITDLARIS